MYRRRTELMNAVLGAIPIETPRKELDGRNEQNLSITGTSDDSQSKFARPGWLEPPFATTDVDAKTAIKHPTINLSKRIRAPDTTFRFAPRIYYST